MRTASSVSGDFMNIACPAPAGHHSTRQWLTREECVLPPSGLRRMKEFSPVIKTALGSVGCCAIRCPSFFPSPPPPDQNHFRGAAFVPTAGRGGAVWLLHRAHVRAGADVHLGERDHFL